MYLLNFLQAQIIDTQGNQFNSLQQALGTASNKLALKSKIVGACAGVITKNIFINGNGFTLSCTDFGNGLTVNDSDYAPPQAAPVQ